MRILCIGINYWPDETGIAPFATGRCEYLAGRGHEVIVCTGLPYYPQWRVPAPYRRRLFLRERRNGVTILRSWLHVPRRPSSLSRVIHEGSFICSSFLNAFARSRPDLLFVTSPPLGLALPAMALSRRWRAPYVFHVTDLQPDTTLGLGMLPRWPLASALYRLEAAAYRRAALISTLTETMRQRIVAKGVASEKVRIFSDWAEPHLFDVALPRAESGGSSFVVAHFGNMGVKQGLEVVLEAARLTANEPQVGYLLVGDGAARGALEIKAAKMGLANLRFIALQPQERFLELLAGADLCLVTQQAGVADLVFPSKVLTLLAAGRPVVASVNAGSEIAGTVLKARAGLVVPPQDPRKLADAVLELRAAPSRRAAMGAAGRGYALEHWEREAVLQRLEEELLALTREGATPQPAPASSDSQGGRLAATEIAQR